MQKKEPFIGLISIYERIFGLAERFGLDDAVEKLVLCPTESLLELSEGENAQVSELVECIYREELIQDGPYSAERACLAEKRLLLNLDNVEAVAYKAGMDFWHEANAQNAVIEHYQQRSSGQIVPGSVWFEYKHFNGTMMGEMEDYLQRCNDLPPKGKWWKPGLLLVCLGLLAAWFYYVYTVPAVAAIFSKEWLKYVYGVILAAAILCINGKKRWVIGGLTALGVFMMFKTSTIAETVRAMGELSALFFVFLTVKKLCTEVYRLSGPIRKRRRKLRKEMESRLDGMGACVSKINDALMRNPYFDEADKQHIRDYCTQQQKQYDLLVETCRRLR